MSRIEQLQEKPWYIQLALFGLVATLLYAAFWYFVTSGVRASTGELEGQVAQLRQQNAIAQAASQRIHEHRAAFERAQNDYNELRALLPEQRELTNVLQNIQQLAQRRLTVESFRPKEDTQQDSFPAKPIEVSVSGTYNNIGAFFAQMAALPRIVSVSNFTITRRPVNDQSSGATVGATFTLSAYYVSPEGLQAASNNGASATPGAPATPVAPTSGTTPARTN
jgi:type IV pilus assembly protein PilO